jgi:hypothetical protein
LLVPRLGAVRLIRDMLSDAMETNSKKIPRKTRRWLWPLMFTMLTLASAALFLQQRQQRARLERELIWQKALLARQGGDRKASQRLFLAMAEEAPKDPRPRFEAACDADGMGDYNGAREGFLQVLRLDPQHADARFKLVLLTARAGVSEEAQHHLEILRKVLKPSDARLATARAAVTPR